MDIPWVFEWYPEKYRAFGDVKSSCASPAFPGNKPSPNIAKKKAVTFFTQNVVIHLRMVPELLCTCSVMIGRNTRAAMIA
jgi:hypothetical protein